MKLASKSEDKVNLSSGASVTLYIFGEEVSLVDLKRIWRKSRIVGPIVFTGSVGFEGNAKLTIGGQVNPQELQVIGYISPELKASAFAEGGFGAAIVEGG